MAHSNELHPRKRLAGWTAAALLGVAVAGSAPAVQAETLTESLADAYRNSGLLDQNRAVLRAADEDVAQAVAALRPTLDWAVTSTYRGGPGNAIEGVTTTASLTANMTLFDFGRNRLSVKAAKETVLSTREVLVGIEQNVLNAAVNAFFDVREGFETVSLRQNNVRLISEELRAAEDRFEVGEVTRTDVASAESRLASARSNLATAQGDLSIAIAGFTEAVGRQPGPLSQPRSTPALPPNAREAKVIARQTHPDILSLQHQITAAELNLERARRAVQPTLTGQLGLSAPIDEELDSYGLEDWTGTASVTLSGTISQGGRLNAQSRAAQSNVAQLRAGLRLTTLAIDEAVDSAYASLSSARANIVATDEQIRAATVAFQGVREEATLGARTTLDVLDAEQELLDARANRVSAVAAEFRAAYGVLSAIGQLTAEDLGLPVQLYDPAGYYNLVKGAPLYLPSSERGQRLDRVLESLGKN